MKERLEFLERHTAFKRRDLDVNVNYRKKAGLLATINREASRMTSEDEFRRRADLEMQQQAITGELGLTPRFQRDEAADKKKGKGKGKGNRTEPSSVPSSTPARPKNKPRKPGRVQ
jgi:general secretion pathway protein D